MSVICYPSAGKKKALRICEAFAQGANGTVAEPGETRLAPGAAFFYGMTDHTLPLIRQCQREQREWYYADNAYYWGRGTHFRVTRGRLMHDGRGLEVDRGFPRSAVAGVEIRPWPARLDEAGEDIIVTTQSELFYSFRLGISRQTWCETVVEELRRHTDRPIEICNKPHPKDMAKHEPHSRAFEAFLDNAWCLVTHSSSTALKALAEGVPVIWLGEGPDYAMCRHMARTSLSDVDKPLYPEHRASFFEALLSQQWTLEEMEAGRCWAEISR